MIGESWHDRWIGSPRGGATHHNPSEGALVLGSGFGGALWRNGTRLRKSFRRRSTLANQQSRVPRRRLRVCAIQPRNRLFIVSSLPAGHPFAQLASVRMVLSCVARSSVPAFGAFMAQCPQSIRWPRLRVFLSDRKSRREAAGNLTTRNKSSSDFRIYLLRVEQGVRGVSRGLGHDVRRGYRAHLVKGPVGLRWL